MNSFDVLRVSLVSPFLLSERLPFPNTNTYIYAVCIATACCSAERSADPAEASSTGEVEFHFKFRRIRFVIVRSVEEAPEKERMDRIEEALLAVYNTEAKGFKAHTGITNQE